MNNLGQIQKEAWVTVLLSAAIVRQKIAKDLKRTGTMPLELYEVLLVLEEAPDQRLRMCDLAEAAVLSPSGVTRLVDRLEKAGLVVRGSCLQDRRTIYASLTPAGVRAREEAWPVYREAIQRHFGALLSDEEARAVRDILVKTLGGRPLYVSDACV
ncbi:MAG TPA: MarR family transcriptional regulator [Fimbriimonadaceae bacterium]|nr:MarR family transcriptional regulator [Fimbriimonadaceae bacterium]HRJ97770.1 MarR family transcriptional regulator [Fimbriimonadaceae bacterium]